MWHFLQHNSTLLQKQGTYYSKTCFCIIIFRFIVCFLQQTLSNCEKKKSFACIISLAKINFSILDDELYFFSLCVNWFFNYTWVCFCIDLLCVKGLCIYVFVCKIIIHLSFVCKVILNISFSVSKITLEFFFSFQFMSNWFCTYLLCVIDFVSIC